MPTQPIQPDLSARNWERLGAWLRAHRELAEGTGSMADLHIHATRQHSGAGVPGLTEGHIQEAAKAIRLALPGDKEVQ